MVSRLIIVPVERLQDEVNSVLSELNGHIGVYLSLNKTQKSLVASLEAKGILTEKIFFIDAVSSQQADDEVLHLAPDNLDQLLFAIRSFESSIPGEIFLIIDALSTLLIYNSENKVASFVSELVNLSPDKLRVIAFSPRTKGEELLDKIFNFFDEVKK